MLDILQSAIIAVIIAILVFGIHLMTMRTKVENDVFQRMQTQADAAAAILQEEIKTLSDFIAHPDGSFTNDITFINTTGDLVLIAFDNDEGNLNIIYKDEDDEIISSSSYQLNLDENELTFSLLTLNTSTNQYVPATNKDEVNLLRVNLGLRSRDEEFYQDMIQNFIVIIERDFFLRNIHLRNMVGTY